MKKIFGIMTAALVLTAGFMFTGCAEAAADLKQAVAAPEATWCKMEVKNYKKADTDTASTNLYAYFYYSKTGLTSDGTDAGLNPSITIPAGLTIIVTTTSNTNSDSIISGLTNNTIIKKTFLLNEETVADDKTDSQYKVSNPGATWNAIYWGTKSEIRDEANKSKNVPGLLRKDVGATELNWDSVKDNFSWKRLLVNYLLDKPE